jgi:hypothetical protein
MYKYRFEIIYATENMVKASEFLKSCDLDIGEVGFPIKIEFQSKTDSSIDKLKEYLKEAFHYDKFKVLHIEGGRVE